jgi:hypothetical protein
LTKKFTKSKIRNDATVLILTGSKNILTGMTLFFLHSGKQRRNVIIIGGVILAIGLIGMITMGSVVIQDTSNNNLTS